MDGQVEVTQHGNERQPVAADVFGLGRPEIVDTFCSPATPPPSALTTVQRLSHSDQVSPS